MRIPISRRHVLKGLGTAISLPFLETMLPSMATAQTAANKKYLAMTFPNGVFPQDWSFGSILSPIVPYKNYFSVLTEVNNHPAGGSAEGAHEAEATCSLTTAVCPKQNGGVSLADAPRLYYSNGGPQMSIDQVLADSIGAQSRIKHIAVAPLIDAPGPQKGYHADNLRYISWRGSTPVTPFASVSDLFNEIFGNGTPGSDPNIAIRNQRKKSILDYVKESSDSLNRKLGIGDKRRMDSYFEAIREVETRLQRAPSSTTCSSDGVTANAGLEFNGLGYVVWAKANLDLIILAFQCGLTKVATFALASGGSYMTEFHRFINNPNLRTPIHHFSHYEPQNSDPIKCWKDVNTYFVGRLAYAMQKMMAIDEGGSNMLDNSMILFMSGMAEGHWVLDLPVVLAVEGI